VYQTTFFSCPHTKEKSRSGCARLDWEWIDDEGESIDVASKNVVEDEESDNFSDEEDLGDTFITHLEVFKCIGGNKRIPLSRVAGFG